MLASSAKMMRRSAVVKAMVGAGDAVLGTYTYHALHPL
jgi:hypothetical protein